MEIESSEYESIAHLIHSDQSPVGIDAKKTHIYIIHMLRRIEDRLTRLEERLGVEESGSGPS